MSSDARLLIRIVVAFFWLLAALTFMWEPTAHGLEVALGYSLLLLAALVSSNFEAQYV